MPWDQVSKKKSAKRINLHNVHLPGLAEWIVLRVDTQPMMVKELLAAIYPHAHDGFEEQLIEDARDVVSKPRTCCMDCIQRQRKMLSQIGNPN